MFSAISTALLEFLQDGFDNKFLERLFWFGAFPAFFLAAALEKRLRPLPKAIDFVTAVFFVGWVLAWFARAYFVLFESSVSAGNRLIETVSGWPVVEKAIQYALNSYNYADGWLAPYTDYVLLVGPLILLSLFKMDKVKPKAIQMAFNSWVIIAGFVLLGLAVNVMIQNPAAALLYASAIPIVQLYGFSTSIRLQKVYTTKALFRDFELASELEEDGRMSELVRTMSLVLTITAFWFHLSVAPDTQIAFFASVIGGLLAIVGFAALVFTFTHERLPTPAMGRQIGTDTRAAQKAAGATLMCAIVGILMTDGPLTLDIREMSLVEVFRATALFVSVIGFAYAIDSALILFRHVVEVMVEVDSRETSMTVIFEEGNIPSHNSAAYKEGNGHSQLREALEHAGCATLVAKSAQWSGIFRQNNPILFLGRRGSPYQEQAIPFFNSFVERGGLLLILTDKSDLPNKLALMSSFGIQVSGRDIPHWGAAKLRKQADEELLPDRYDAYISLSLHSDEDDKVIVETTFSGADLPFVSEPLAFLRPYGKGKVIVVGSLFLFTNNNLVNHRTYHFLDRLIALAKEHFGTKQHGQITQVANEQ